MVADLSQLHHEVLKGLLAQLAGLLVKSHHTPLLDLIVYLLLPCGELDLDHILHFLRQLGLHVLLHSAQQERAKDLMKPVDNEQLLLFIKSAVFFVGSHSVEGSCEPLLEILAARKHLWEEEVQQRPQFCHIVLQRRTSEQ